MNKIINILLCITAFLLFACSPIEKNIFDDSAANRIDAALKAEQDVLIGAKNGWLMSYYPSSSQAYGGYNVLVSFTADKATVSSEITRYGDNSDPALKTASSLYRLKQSAGPVLTFDAYNDIFHIFSDPNRGVSGIGNDGVGMGGDFEFLILKATPDSVILKGKKTSNRIVMTPMKEGMEWKDYLTQLQEISKTTSFPKFEYQVGDKTIPVSRSYRTLIFTYTNDEGNEVSETIPYIQTLTGYKLYSPLTIGGITVEELTYKKEGDMDVFTPTNGADAKLIAIVPPLNETLVSGNWYFKYSELGTSGKAYWDHTKTNGFDKIGEVLYNAYMGKFIDGKYGFCFGSRLGSSLYRGALLYSYKLEGKDEIIYTFSLNASGDGAWYYQNAAFNFLITPVANAEPRTFKLTSDNPADPTWILLTDTKEADNTIKLFKDEVVYPYDN